MRFVLFDRMRLFIYLYVFRDRLEMVERELNLAMLDRLLRRTFHHRIPLFSLNERVQNPLLIG